MGNIIITSAIKRNMITGDIVESDRSTCHVEIEDEIEQFNFYTFIYCSAAMHIYPFVVPGDSDDFSDYVLDETPECHTCDFKNTNRWDRSLEHYSDIDQSAYEHSTLLYKELMADGSLRNNTTYMEIIEAYKREDERDISGPFDAGVSVPCPVCSESHGALVVSPSLDALVQEEKNDETHERLYYAQGTNGLWYIYITGQLKTKFQNTLDKCLLMKKFSDVYAIIFHNGNDEVIEAYKRLLTPKHRGHFLGLSIPVKYKSKQEQWKDFLSES